MPAVAEKAEKFVNPLLVKGKGKAEKLDPKSLLLDRKFQARVDIDSTAESPVDMGRAERFAEAMSKGAKFPPVKVFRVADFPGKKDEVVDLVVDGLHTTTGALLAKLKEIDAVVFEGTYAQALNYASTVSNRDDAHEQAPRALSTKDKIRAVAILARAFKESGLPKKEWPSNRVAAEMCGCSRQLVNEMDPFERGAGDKREETAEKKRKEREAAKNAIEAGKAHLNGTNGHVAAAAALDPVTKSPVNFEIVQKATGQPVAAYHADTAMKAVERFRIENPDKTIADVVAREYKAPEPKAGSERTTGFDWSGVESSLSHFVRGLDGMGDLYDLKKTPEYKEAFAAADKLAAYFRKVRGEHAGKKPAAKK